MAETKETAPKIEYRHNVAKAQHEIGVRAGKYFVPFATLDDAVFAQRLENAENVASLEGDGEGEAG